MQALRLCEASEGTADMPDYLLAMTYALVAGLAIPLGGAMASADRFLPGWLQEEFRHSVIAFGAGVLLAAIALVLVPEGNEALSPAAALGAFLLGGVVFALVDHALDKRGGSGAQLLAMVLDFVPEALALGAMLAVAPDKGLLLAILMALQNLPEAFNAYREMRATTALKTMTIIMAFAGLSLLGPIAAATGYFMLKAEPEILGAIMLFATGGILYLVTEDIIPQVPLKRAWGPPFGTVAGFALGMLGQALTS